MALGATFPASFYAHAGELIALSATPAFHRAFPATRLLLGIGEIQDAREDSDASLLPFMYSAREYPDVFAFAPSAAGAEPVVVWCVHTTVQEWPDFPRFMSWVRNRCEKESPSS